MRKRKNDTKSPADPAAAHIEISLYPYRDDTAFAVVLVRGLGARATRLRVLAGHLPVRRADLAEHPAWYVTQLLGSELCRHLEATGDNPLEMRDEPAGSAVIGAPLGATGGTVGQLELDFS